MNGEILAARVVVPMAVPKERGQAIEGPSTVAPSGMRWIKLRIAQQRAFLSELLEQSSHTVGDDDFGVLVYLAVNHYGVRPRKIAKALGVAPSAISRWVAGANAPREYARKSVLSVIAALLQEEITILERTVAKAKKK